MATHTLRMPAHCLEQPEHWQTCSQCLRQRLGQMPGIRKIDLQRTDTNDQAIVHLDYDPRLLSLNQLDAQVRHASLCLHPQRRQIVMGIDGMIAPRNEQQIESALAKLPGVVASASFASRSCVLSLTAPPARWLTLPCGSASWVIDCAPLIRMKRTDC